MADSPRALTSLGVNVWLLRLVVFGISAALAGLAGAALRRPGRFGQRGGLQRRAVPGMAVGARHCRSVARGLGVGCRRAPRRPARLRRAKRGGVAAGGLRGRRHGRRVALRTGGVGAELDSGGGGGDATEGGAGSGAGPPDGGPR